MEVHCLKMWVGCRGREVGTVRGCQWPSIEFMTGTVVLCMEQFSDIKGRGQFHPACAVPERASRMPMQLHKELPANKLKEV
jgi:hypothetical protein